MTPRARWRRLLAGPALATALLAGCTNHPVPGTGLAPVPKGPYTDAMKITCAGAVEAGCVTVGNVSTVSGFVPGLFEGAQVGADAYLSMIDTEGGVDGRTIRLDAMDDAFNATTNRSATEALLSHVVAFVGSFSLEDEAGGEVLKANPQMPNVSVSLSDLTANLPNTFSVNPATAGWQTGPLRYFEQHFPEATQHVGLLEVDVSTAQQQVQRMATAMRQVGYHIVDNLQFGPYTTDFRASILRLRDDGVQMVDLTGMDASDAEHVVAQMRTEGYHPQVIEANGAIYVPGFVQAAGAAAADGVYLTQPDVLYLGTDADKVPAVRQFLGWVQKVHPGFATDLYTLYGWTSAELFVQALRSASGPPSESSVEQALRQIHDFGASGLLSPVDPVSHRTQTCWIIAQVQHGQFVRIPPTPTNGGFVCST